MAIDQAVKLGIAIEIIYWLKYFKDYSPDNLNGLDGIVQNIYCDLTFRGKVGRERNIFMAAQ